MGIVVRAATSDDDLEAWRRVRMAVLPDERTLPIEEMRAMPTPGGIYLLAELDGELAGSGLGERSSFDYAGLHPGVLPAARRRGIGTALLRTLEAHALAVGFTGAGSMVDDTQIRNADMLAVNERLGYATRSESITVRAPLPLRPVAD